MAVSDLERGRAPAIEPGDKAGVIIELLERVGVVGDANRDDKTAEISKGIGFLQEGSGVPGEDYPYLPESLVTTEEVAHALDTGEFVSGKTYLDTHIGHSLWTPGAEANRSGYRTNDFGVLVPGGNAIALPLHVRRAVHNLDCTDDPLPHFSAMSFDSEHAEAVEETQLEAFAKTAEAYEDTHEGFSMGVLDAKAGLIIAFMHRIAGDDVSIADYGYDMPFEHVWMYDGTKPRRTIDGRSIVGCVDSRNGQLVVGGMEGKAGSKIGLGLSAGPREFEAQIS